MSEEIEPDGASQAQGNVWMHSGIVAGSALVLGLLSLAIASLSAEFLPSIPTLQRPLFLVLGLFAASFVVYLLGLWSAVRLRERISFPVILLCSLVFRLILLDSTPIQEVDIYRYLWDGTTSVQGISPYRFSPLQVQRESRQTVASDELRTLVELKERYRGKEQVLNLVHFGRYTTPYPPVSQVVFAMAAWLTPVSASVSTHLLVMKFFIVVFDLGTLWLMARLVRRVGLPIGWTVAYGWCPLVLKEFANSGHLDSITVFLTMASVDRLLVAIGGVQGEGGSNVESPSPRPSPRGRGGSDNAFSQRSFASAMMAVVLLALAVGGKLYPVVLAPAFLMMGVRHFGWVKSVALGLGFVVLMGLILLPMWLPYQQSDAVPDAGVKAFVQTWQSNDLLFSIVVENLKPDPESGEKLRPWFVFTPGTFRSWLVGLYPGERELPRFQVPFYFTRAASLLAWLGICAWLMVGLWKSPTAEKLLSCSFLLIAWFWLLSPTLNPWYWLWALPLVPFVRDRSWLLMSGLLFVYYTLFWFQARSGEMWFLGQNYQGRLFFDFVVVWLEYVPFFVVWGVERFVARRA